MNNRRNNLDTMLSLLREHPPTEPVLSREDVRRTLAGAGSAPKATPPRLPKATVAMSVLGTVVAGAAALLMLSNDTPRDAQSPTAGRLYTQHRTGDTSKATQPDGTLSQTPDTLDAFQEATTTTVEQSAPEAHTTPTRNHALKSASSGKIRQITFRIGDNLGRTPDSSKKSSVDVPGIMVITQTTYDSSDVARNRARRQSADTALDVNGIGALELTPQELAQLGVEVTPNGLRLFAEERYTTSDSRMTEKLYKLGYDTTQAEFIRRYSVEIDTFSVGLNTVSGPVQGRYSRIVPIVIYNQYIKTAQAEGSHLSYFSRSPLLSELIAVYHGSSDEMKQEVFNLHEATDSRHSAESIRQRDLRQFPLASKLVPIYVRMGNSPIEGTTSRRGADIYLWYYPTREFLAALPDRYRIPLSEEVEAMADVEADRLDSQDACECLTGGPSLLGICRSRSGAVVSASLYPNPAGEKATVSFRLMEPRHVTITLHDLSGHYISTLANGAELNIGDHHAALNLADVQQGTYLVVVRTDQGEQAVQRLIVQQ